MSQLLGLDYKLGANLPKRKRSSLPDVGANYVKLREVASLQLQL